MKKRLLLLITALSVSSAFAESISTPIQASATVNSTCNVSARNISFGNITPSMNSYSATNGQILTRCSSGMTYTLSLSSGSSGNASERTMLHSQGSEKLSYNIYLDAAYNTILGDGTNATSQPTLVGNGSVGGADLYAKLENNQYVTPGIYTDNLTVTLTY